MLHDRDKLEQEFLRRYPDRLVSIDSHTQGEPTRLLIGGIGDPPGGSMQAKREFFMAHHDQVRRLLTCEPRGHRDMFAAVLTEPVSPGASFGLIYMDARRYPYLCGHATIGAVTALIETGVLSAPEGENDLFIDTPSGPVSAHASVEAGRVESVALDMVPSFVQSTGCTLDVPGFGSVTVDLVCVGGFFAMVSARSIGLALSPANSRRLIAAGMAVIQAANGAFSVSHPQRPEVGTVDVAEFHEHDENTGAGRSAVIYGEAHLDRSPCGTGTAAKMTLLHHQGLLTPGQLYRNRSLLDTEFTGSITTATRIGPHTGCIARICGSARLTGYHQFVLDQADPFPQGFLL